MLGVSPEASHDEIKRAFTERALRYHPSRQPASDSAAAERSAWRLREVNQAWATLRSPAARATYDRSLRPEPERGVAVGTGGRGSGLDLSTLFQEPEIAEIEPVTEEPEAPPSRARQLVGAAPMIIGGAVLAVVVVMAAWGSRPDDSVDVQTQERLAKGACVVVTGDAVSVQGVKEVPCSTPHDGKVEAKVDIPKACPLSTRNIMVPAIEQSICLRD